MKPMYLILLTMFIINTVTIFSENVNSGLLDSAVNWGNGRIYFQSGNQYIRFNLNGNKAANGYPRDISPKTWPGVTFTSIEAAMDLGNGKIYLFTGKMYLRYDKKKNRVDAGYPKEINNKTWPGINFTAIDAAFNAGLGKVYFFKGNEYVRFDIEADKADPGYPKKINNTTWPGLPFSKIDAATIINDKAFFFSGTDYVRFDLQEDTTDPGYPKNISENWKGLEFAPATAPGIEKPEPPQPATPGTTSFEITAKSLDISPGVVHNTSSVLGYTKMAASKDGNIWLGYQSKKNTGLIPLDAQLNKRGTGIVLKGYFLSDLMPMKDGSLMVVASKDINNDYIEGYPNTIYLIKLDSKGREIFTTYIFGGEGHGPGKSWFDGRSKGKIAYNGKEFGIYFEVQKNWADPGQKADIHNGDMFVVVDSKGKIRKDREHFWTASHSSTIHVAAGKDGDFYTTTIGDAYPYGLQFYNRNKDKAVILWPPEEDYIPYEKVNSTNAAGILEFFAASGSDFITLMGTLEHPNIGVFDKVDVLFFRFDKDGKMLKQKWLARTKNYSETLIVSAPVGDNYLVGWGMGNDYDNDWKADNARLSLIDPDGEFIIPPREVDYPLGTYSNFCPLPGGRIAWSLADNGTSVVDFYTVDIK